jgi:hypothetical protein
MMVNTVGVFVTASLSTHFYCNVGLIHWKIVFHAFINGFAHFVTAIQANNNNCASTVLDLFLGAIEVHGAPSRVQGDHGTENLCVAKYMETEFGVERGSYIWGRCVFLMAQPQYCHLILTIEVFIMYK